MEIGYLARRTLIPVLMDWVAQSRLQKHLNPGSIFIMYIGTDTVQVNLSNLSEDYQKKHIDPNLSIYALSFIQHITPTLIQWCQKNNLQFVEMDFRFKTEKQVYSVMRAIKAKKVDPDLQEYLENKST